ncbi:hypothetical protein O181_119913 [Austropuccinia psidii MF-1]|uniref:Ras-GAP domain-containing protein n=1 Tax=Austropuccinia psidii MF-1 TaxID=1389203 RepID=A0A9Q3KER9_9BASI|nr:hypothetical protein [Austropuccinia psidii MF-1]
MICQPNIMLALAICKFCGSADFKEMTEVILNIFDNQKGIIKFLKAAIEREVAETEHQSTVLCGNSFTTQLLTISAQAQGYDYLQSTLANFLLGLSNKPTEFLVDFGPHRPSDEDDKAARNLDQLTNKNSINEIAELNYDLASVPLDAADRYVLHRFMYDNVEKISTKLKSMCPTEFKHWYDGTEKLTPALGQQICQELLTSQTVPNHTSHLVQSFHVMPLHQKETITIVLRS